MSAKRAAPSHEPAKGLLQSLRAGGSQPAAGADEESAEWPVWELVVSPTEERAACLMRRGAVELYTLGEGGLALERGLGGGASRGKLQRPAGLHFRGPSACMAAETGAVHCWDWRAGATPRVSLKALEGATAPELFSCSSQGDLVAAGGNSLVYFWDLRRPDLELQCFEDAHSSEVTVVAFHPERDRALVTADEEGNVAAWQLASIGEEEDYKAGLSLAGETPVRAGFHGEGGKRMWFCTATDTFHLWDWESACLEDAPGGAGTLADVKDAPNQLSECASASGEKLSVGSLVGCCYDPSTEQLWLGAGTPEGAAGLWVVKEPLGQTKGDVMFGPALPFRGGHSREVHVLQWLPLSRRALSAGDDGCIALWEGGSSGSSPLPKKKKLKQGA